MRDTPPEVEQRFREMLFQRSGEEGLKMGCSMYATARALVRAFVLDKEPDASPATIRRALFLRFYHHDFDPKTREKILLALEGTSGALHPIGRGEVRDARLRWMVPGSDGEQAVFLSAAVC